MNFFIKKKDWKLVSSASATERIKLWNRFSGPIDQETIKADFLRKAHQKNPPFRFKLKPKLRDRVEIPPVVEYHYINRPPLLPSLKDVLRYEAISKKINFDLINDNDDNSNDINLEKIINDDLKAFENAEKIIKLNDTDDDLNEINEGSNKKDNIIDDNDDDEPESKKIKKDLNDIDYDIELKDLDLSLIKLLAIQRLQQIIKDNPNIVKELYCNNDKKKDIIKQECIKLHSTMQLPSQLLSKDEIERIAKMFVWNSDKTTSSSNEIKENNQNTGNNNNSNDINCNDIEMNPENYAIIKSDDEKIREFIIKIERPLMESNVRCRAVLTPVQDILLDR